MAPILVFEASALYTRLHYGAFITDNSIQMLSDPKGFWSETSNTRIAPLDLTSAQGGAEDLRDDIRRALDEELAAMTLAMSSIRSRRNALSRPCRLPSEVLARCFWFLVAIDPPRSASLLGWIQILHVCAHFRQVALSEPLLWTEISFTLGRKWASHMVSLAKAAPLSIKKTVTAYQWISCKDEVRQLVHDHISHIRELVLEEDSGPLSSMVDVAEPAPILETLDLRLRNIYRSTEDHIIAPNFLAQHAPRLRTIHLHGFPLPSTAFPLLSTVVDLTIRLRHDSTLRPSVDTFFSMLESVPSLEHFNTVYFLPKNCGDSAVALSTRSGSLPRLVRLRIQGANVDCPFVLRRLIFPHTTQLDLEVELLQEFDPIDGSTPNDCTSQLFPIIINHTRKDTSPRIRTLKVNTGPAYVHTIEVKAWELSGTHTIEGIAGSPIFNHHPETPTLSLKLEHAQAQRPSLATIATLFDLCDLRALFVSLPGQTIDKDQWTSTLENCKDLQYVKITGGSSYAISFCCALLPAAESARPSPSPAKSRGGAKKTRNKRGRRRARGNDNCTAEGGIAADVFLPNLVSLDVHGVDFEVNTPGHNKPFHEFLAVMLKKRQAMGKPIQRLSLSQCVICEEWVVDLEKIVPQVEWDKVTGFGGEDEEHDEDEEGEDEDEFEYGYGRHYYGDDDVPYGDPFYDSDFDDIGFYSF